MYKCPVCDAQSSAMICTQCGFDGSGDLERHPTLGKPAALPDAVSRLRQQRQGKEGCLCCPRCAQRSFRVALLEDAYICTHCGEKLTMAQVQAQKKALLANDSAVQTQRKRLIDVVSQAERSASEKLVQVIAEAGDQIDAQEQFNMGMRYYLGNGVEKNMTEAVKCFRQAADRKNAEGQYMLGRCYHYGKGVTQDYAKAIALYFEAADQGLVQAQTGLGCCYHLGEGVPQDYVQAFEWTRKAADQGYKTAQNNLGVCYENGIGVAQNYAKAVEYYFKAADQNEDMSQYRLGYCYEHGKGVMKNKRVAADYYLLATRNGNSSAEKAYRELFEQATELELQILEKHGHKKP